MWAGGVNIHPGGCISYHFSLAISSGCKSVGAFSLTLAIQAPQIRHLRAGLAWELCPTWSPEGNNSVVISGSVEASVVVDSVATVPDVMTSASGLSFLARTNPPAQCTAR